MLRAPTLIVILLPILFASGILNLCGSSAAAQVFKRLYSKDTSREEISIVGLMAKRLLAETSMASGYVGFGTILTVAIIYFVQGTLSIPVLLSGTLLIFLFGLRYLLFAYRVQAGYYGSNISEAREIIEFIEQNATDLPGGKGGGGGTRISPTINLPNSKTTEQPVWGIGARNA